MRTSNNKKQGMLQQANAGVLQSDLDKKLQFQDIIQTTLRTDLVIQLAATKRFVIMELIVPWGNDASAYGMKQYQHTLYKERGWQTRLFPSSVMLGFSSTIGIDHIELPRHSRKTTQSCSESARTSCRKSIQLAMIDKRPRELEGVVIL